MHGHRDPGLGPIAARAPAPLGRTWISQSYGADAVPAPLLLREPLDEQSRSTRRAKAYSRRKLLPSNSGDGRLWAAGVPGATCGSRGDAGARTPSRAGPRNGREKSPQRRIAPASAFLTSGAAQQSRAKSTETPMTFSTGMLDVPWWAYVLIALALTHLTIASVTIFLHRHQTHRALDLHPVASHLFRFWLWLTTGMVTREWVAVHRKHHAKTETAEDPHSPQIHGIARVLWAGVFLYVIEARDRATLEKYGHGTPDDWIETHLYARCSFCGPVLMGLPPWSRSGSVRGV